MMGEDKGGWRTLAAGGTAGAIDCCFTMPLDTLGTQIQLLNKGPIECTRAIMKAKGVAGLYAGFWPFLIQSSAKSSIRFLGYETLQNGVDSMGIDRSKMPGSDHRFRRAYNEPVLARVRGAAPECLTVGLNATSVPVAEPECHARHVRRLLVAVLWLGCWCNRGPQSDRAYRSREGARPGNVGRIGQGDHRPATYR